jgi:hypothetical protein
MVVCDHDGFRHPGAHYAPKMVHHGEMDIEANLFSMMTAVACNAKRQYDGASTKFENFRTIKLDDAGRVFMDFALHLTGTGTIRFRFRTSGPHSSG